MTSVDRRRRIAASIAAIVAAGALALPVIAASPSPSGSPAPSAKSHAGGNGHGLGHANANAPGAKPDKSHEPETPITVRGTVTKSTDAGGHPTYTLQAEGASYRLSFGPWWFWGDRKNPLDDYVGKTVTVAGERETDTDTDGATGATGATAAAEVDVERVDGKALREPGKPPWAGGPKVVGPSHPGYKAWKDAQDKASAAP